MSSFRDCEYRKYDSNYDALICKNKAWKVDDFESIECDNCKENIHLNCSNYNPKKDMCLKWFETGVSRLTECKEKTTFSDKDLQSKWSN